MWTTIYIKGKGKFKNKIKRALKYSNLEEGEDYITGSHPKFSLYWLAPTLELREFKLAIKPKNIWEYRLIFFDELAERKIETKLTNEEKELIEEYREK